MCHYCDHTIATPPVCPSCAFDGIRLSGQGTQRLEVEVQYRFPQAKIARMDSDSMRKPGSHEKVLTSFREGATQILLGTQMIAKGLDFPNVLLVGVINADSALHFPDFRAAEKTFQIVTQVAGRTGRGERAGRVLVQTYSPDHEAIVTASRHDFVGFATDELSKRAAFGYPPHGHLARVIVRGPDQGQAEEFADQFGRRLQAVRAAEGLECRILGPAAPPLAKLRGNFRFHLILQSTVPEHLNRLITLTIQSLKPPKEVQYIIDIDPQDTL
jgi:primosomal protein N' (replication factor Y)